MKTHPLAFAAVAAAGLLAGCAHGGAVSEGDLSNLREQVRTLREARDRDSRRIEALEAQLRAVVRRQAAAAERAEEPEARAPELLPPDLAVVRLEPEGPGRQSDPAPLPEAGEDSFIFIVDRGGGEEPEQVSRPSRQARRGGSFSPAGGVDAAPPLPTDISLHEPHPEGYDAGLAALAEGDLDRAERELRLFLDGHRGDGRADNAALALGEVYLARKLPGKALRQWEQVARDYPAGDAVPEALLRYGITCEKLGREAAARAAFERVVQDHPGSEAAVRARARLDEGK